MRKAFAMILIMVNDVYLLPYNLVEDDRRRIAIANIPRCINALLRVPRHMANTAVIFRNLHITSVITAFNAKRKRAVKLLLNEIFTHTRLALFLNVVKRDYTSILNRK